MENKFEKTIWTQVDYPQMGWHDCSIYAIQLADTVDLDIDYILKWVIEGESKSFNFWVAPVTLRFYDTRNLKININLEFVNGLEIAQIEQKVLNETEYEYLIETQEGTIELIASGFTQTCRKPPILKSQQCLSEEERGGYLLKKVR
jgi:hypothetical protein